MWRVVDASLNRAAEGLRVAEEVLRFCGCADGFSALKRLRHRLRQVFAPVRSQLLAARDTLSDPGRVTSTQQEFQRRDISAVFAANIIRAQEALRVLEETAKVHSPDMAREIESIRFEVYRIEKEWGGRLQGRVVLQNARLYVVCSRGGDEAVRIAAAVAAVADIFQLRLKDVGGREYLRVARGCREALSGSGTLFVVNDRSDVALLSGADGVHLGAQDIPPDEARKMFCGIVGATVHNSDDLKSALQAGVDYLGVGAFYPTKTKKDARVQGSALAEMMDGVDVVWFAIGGITEERLGELVEMGVERVAVGEAICGADDVRGAARRMKERLLRLLAERGDDFNGVILEP
ncbi:MAG: thiamine phosphate synthase [Planctomycetota bacterium]|nr:MAG: thiamine phosphate synthase [Planctomycetota bacterium]